MPIHNQRTYSVAILFLAVILMGSYCRAGEIKGKVDIVLRDTLFIKLDSDIIPNVGDKIEVIASSPGGDAAPLGTWVVSKIKKGSVIAKKIEAMGPAEIGMDVIIYSESTTIVAPVKTETPKVVPAPIVTRREETPDERIPPVAQKTGGARLGLEYKYLDQELRQQYNVPLSTRGLFVVNAVLDSPAFKAGLKLGDIITGFDGKVLNDSSDLASIVSALSPGTKVNITIVRKGWEKDFTVVLGGGVVSQVKKTQQKIPSQSRRNYPPLPKSQPQNYAQPRTQTQRGGYDQQQRQERNMQNREAAGKLLVDLLKLRDQAIQDMNK